MSASDGLTRPTRVHPTAVVAPGAQLGQGVEIGPHAVIGENVSIGDGTVVGPGAVIEGWTTIGKNCRVGTGVCLGGRPQDYKYKGEKTFLKIGDNNDIREYVTMHRGTADGRGETVVGSGCLFMAYSHVAHDCVVGDGVTIINSAQLAGHCVVEDYAVISGLAGVHQFCRVGKMAMVGGMTKVVKDVPPFMLVDGNPASVRGINVVGLRRHNVPPAVREQIRQAYRILCKSRLSVSHAIERMMEELQRSPEIDHLIDFLRSSARGVMR
ncbi:MAG: acyl-ACP--UDP-N-acetylglucosamine O-acyltransferase [Bacillota bacterium]|nr:acyl-ACP--UDP-N-acetylglucosamine O-acyltransferase [Bacillota bacterium]HOB90525.1 acyl-ACP--UDP-N-acetylglucosamine O-acyltransferase [Bacillota bacterium]HPZ53735.1 acyl-ACP--UDP-N-acetylglucosamine O-acyltransferase [Bacillota bacterium]HQD17903.1 acyl-ACP--UDP-N-acetylglucosamine O-acyltransferase [Bacillota bacterium]